MVTQHCPQAASLQLRPSLQKVQEDLLSTITSAVQLKQNASLLVLGEPGIGKTLVRLNSPVDSNEVIRHSQIQAICYCCNSSRQ